MALSIRKKHKIIGGAGLLASLGFFTAMNSVSLFSSPIAKADAINDYKSKNRQRRRFYGHAVYHTGNWCWA
jgi:hypothetical protein